VSARLPDPAGALIDRDRPIAFTFEGRHYTGYAGDTLASALWANNVRTLSRSFKYHRRRGVLTMAGQDANTLVQVGPSPNVPADRLALSPGLAASAVNTWGGVERDLWSVIGRLGRFLPVGFYYKSFFKPRWAWPLWEPVLRRVAGLGKVDTGADHGYYDKQYMFADVAVIGGGPAGLAAAAAAAEAGAEVVLIDENARLGGSLDYARVEGGLRARLVDAVTAQPAITMMTDTMCNGCFADNWLALIRGDRMFKLRAKAIVLASGSMEQPVVFRDNDLPGVMLGTAAQRLIRLYGVRPGRRAVVLCANGDGYGVALDLIEAGVTVACVADLREKPGDDARMEEVRAHGVPLRLGATVWEAVAGRDGTLAAARVAQVTGRGTCAAPGERFECDLIAMSAGYMPTGALACHAGGRMVYDDARHTFRAADTPDGMTLAGSVAGVHDLDAVIKDGRAAGIRAAGGDGGPAQEADDAGLNHPWPIFPHADGHDFVDFDEDLQVKDIRDAVAEGYDHIELAKRFSTATMGPSQGRHSLLPTARLVAEATKGAVGATTARPPFAAETFGHLAGRAFEPVRRTAMHARHVEAGARMMPAGMWMRPAYYGPKHRRDACIVEEVTAVREAVGLIDVSTLGGIEIRGPDAAEFMNRVYTFAYLKQPVGRGRYVLMTDRTGVIIDDGVACRFAEDHFYVTATTSGVDAVYRAMLWHNAQWRLAVDVTHVSAAYAGVNIAGPKSRDVLAPLCADVDISAAAFPYMGVREGRVAGIPARLLRVGFVGELGFEIHVPAHAGEALWDALMEAGHGRGIRPFGVEAQRLLRLEKGHIIIGQDTDGLTHPLEADMAWAISRKKPYFVGKRAIALHEKVGLTRKMVGFEIGDAASLPEECHLVVRGAEITGRVTSAATSPTLGKVIGLAYVAPDQAEVGNTFTVKIGGGKLVEARVVKLPFYDPDGRRQEM